MVNYIIHQLGLDDVVPVEDTIKIGLISRRRKRFILNEYELVNTVHDVFGYECELLSFESMTLYEQIKVIRSLDVLIGIHGSGLDNVVFLHPGSVMVQLMPFSNTHKALFVEHTLQAHVVYQEWTLQDR
jgi:capsular polysaccharide biosynthesis protein